MKLTQHEILRAAIGCRAAAFQADIIARQQASEDARRSYLDDSQAFVELAERFEREAGHTRTDKASEAQDRPPGGS